MCPFSFGKELKTLFLLPCLTALAHFDLLIVDYAIFVVDIFLIAPWPMMTSLSGYMENVIPELQHSHTMLHAWPLGLIQIIYV